MHSIVFPTVIASILHWGFVSSEVTATIPAGTLTGGICTSNSNAAFFKSIPYAQPPIHNLRYLPPQALAGTYKLSNTPYDATTPAPSCPQFGGGFEVETGTTSEDCLYIDIWTPANFTTSSKLPVRVWLYGGSNYAGSISDPEYDGCQVPSTGDGAIMVSINYRVGPLGFLALKEAGIAGNMGIQDALLGLKWVKDNIDAFGGDPEQVMLHGQSAGAFDTFIIATLPQAPTLLKGAIMMSGGGIDIAFPPLAQSIGQQYTTGLGCELATAASCLRNKSVTDLQNAVNNLPFLNEYVYPNIAINGINSFTFGPYVDGTIIPTQPSTSGVRVPSVFGTTSMEGTIFALAEFFDPTTFLKSANESAYHIFLAENFGTLAPEVEKYYPVSLFKDTPFPAFYAISQINTDFGYFCPAWRGLNVAKAKGVPVWTYLFNHTLSCPWYAPVPAAALQLVGATHTSDIPFMLDTTKHLPLPNGTCNFNAAEQNIAKFMADAFTSMAKSGAPVPVNDGKMWPMWTGKDSSEGITVDNEIVVGKVDYSRCEFWDYIDKLQYEAAQAGLLNGANETLPTGSGGTGTGGNATGTSGPVIETSAISGGSRLGMSVMAVLGGIGVVSNLM